MLGGTIEQGFLRPAGGSTAGAKRFSIQSTAIRPWLQMPHFKPLAAATVSMALQPRLSTDWWPVVSRYTYKFYLKGCPKVFIDMQKFWDLEKFQQKNLKKNQLKLS